MRADIVPPRLFCQLMLICAIVDWSLC